MTLPSFPGNHGRAGIISRKSPRGSGQGGESNVGQAWTHGDYGFWKARLILNDRLVIAGCIRSQTAQGCLLSNVGQNYAGES